MGGIKNRCDIGHFTRAVEFRIHPDFTTLLENDIALVRVQTPFIAQNIGPIILDIQATLIPEGTGAVMLGWGRTNQSESFAVNLQRVIMPVMSLTRCNSTLGHLGIITQTSLCAGENLRDTCDGDNGGPLVAFGRLIGIASWNFGCGDATLPAVFTRIAAANIRTWILLQTGL